MLAFWEEVDEKLLTLVTQGSYIAVVAVAILFVLLLAWPVIQTSACVQRRETILRPS